MIFRVGFLVVACVSAFALTRVNIDLSRRRRHISTKTPKNDNCTLQHEEIQEKDKFENSNLVESEEEEEVTSNRRKTKQDLKQNYLKSSDCMSFESRIYDEKRNNLRGIELLKNQVKDMEQRRVILEVRLLELHGLREQQINFVQLKSQLKAKVEEIDMLNVTVDALEAEKKNLHEEIKQNHLAENQIETARKRIVEMQAKLQMKGHLVLLKEQVCGLDEMEKKLVRDANVESKFRAVKGLEIEVVEMKRRNKELQLEKRELAVKLTASQAGVTALSNMTESKIVADIEAEISSLRLANEELSEQADRLQGNRFSMVDELMYQRWLNACLRFESQNSSLNAQWKISKTRKVMSKNLSSEFNKKRTNHLSLDSILGSISSHSSSSDIDEKTGSTIDDSSSSSQKSVRKKSSLIQKIKRWGRSKDDTSREGLIRRRFSMSMVPLNTSMIKNGGENVVKDPETTLKRVRRVSFSDSVQSVESTFEVRPKCVQGVLDNDQTSNKRMGNMTMMNTSNGSTGKLEGEESEFSSPAFSTVIRTESSSNLLSKQDVENESKCEEIQMISKSDHIGLEEPTGMPNVPQSVKQVGAQDLVHLLVALFFLILILLVCSIIFTASKH